MTFVSLGGGCCKPLGVGPGTLTPVFVHPAFPGRLQCAVMPRKLLQEPCKLCRLQEISGEFYNSLAFATSSRKLGVWTLKSNLLPHFLLLSPAPPSPGRHSTSPSCLVGTPFGHYLITTVFLPSISQTEVLSPAAPTLLRNLENLRA